MGRWTRLRREERICKQCPIASGEVEDKMHFVLHCEGLSEERTKLGSEGEFGGSSEATLKAEGGKGDDFNSAAWGN